MGWEFGSDAFHDLMDRGVNDKEVEAIKQTLLATPGVEAPTTYVPAKWVT